MPARRTESDVEQVGNWHSRKIDRGYREGRQERRDTAGRQEPQVTDPWPDRRQARRRHPVSRPCVLDPGGGRAGARGVGPRRHQQACRFAQLDHIPPRQDAHHPRLSASDQGEQTLPDRPAAVRPGCGGIGRDRDGQPRQSGAAGPRAGLRRELLLCRQDGVLGRRDRADAGTRRVSTHRSDRQSSDRRTARRSERFCSRHCLSNSSRSFCARPSWRR